LTKKLFNNTIEIHLFYKLRRILMQIRTFESTDAAGVKSIISGVMNKEFASEEKAYLYGDLDDISNAYGKLREKFLVAEESAGVAGCVGIKEDSDSTALLRRLFVHPSHRGRDVGSMLVDTALDFCKMSHYKKVVFRATSKMNAAIKLLVEKKGFTEDERYVFDDIEIVMLSYKVH